MYVEIDGDKVNVINQFKYYLSVLETLRDEVDETHEAQVDTILYLQNNIGKLISKLEENIGKEV